MANSRGLKNSLDDAMLAFRVVDFSGGLNSETDPQDLDENASPNCQNVRITKPGRLIGRMGWIARISSLGVNPDGIAFFYDAGGARRVVAWYNGNMYDVTSHSATLVRSGAYTSGNRVTSVALNGTLYYSDGETIHNGDSGIRKWDGTTEERLVSAGGGATIPTPAAKVLTSYAGSLVLGRIKYVGGTYDKHAIMWSNVNDPTTINGTSIQQVGQGFGGEVNSVLPLAVATTGVSPFRALIVGKSEFGLYGYSGALGSLTEFLINCPAGVRDGETMRYIPGPDGSGYVVFLGTDNKVWAVNGTSAVEISGNIRTELSYFIQEQLIADPNQRLTAVVNSNDFQYMLDVGGGRQYCYQYDLKAWTRYSGHPSGHWVEARDSYGNFAVYCADRENQTIAQISVGTDDNGSDINPYWNTPMIHCGDKNILKTWQWIFVSFRTDTGNVVVTATTNLGEGNSGSQTITITPATDEVMIWDVTDWDEGVWGSGVEGSYTAYKKKKRLTYQPSGVPHKELLRGYDVTIKLSTSSEGGHFEILGFTLLYLPRGRVRVAPLT